MCFELDDWPHFQFAFGPPYRAGLSAPSKVLEIWTEEFDWMHRHADGGVLTVCMHPQVIGARPPHGDARALCRALRGRRRALRAHGRHGEGARFGL